MVFTWMANLAMKSVGKRVSTEAEKFATRALIKGRVEGCIGKVVDSLAPFFRDEKMSESQKILLVEECEREFTSLVADSHPLLAGSLDGEKIYEQLYAKRKVPESIRDERLEYYYSLLFPRIAHLICRIPGLVEQWKKEAWAENFRRLDDLAEAMGDLTRKVDEIATSASRVADELLAKVRRGLLQRVSFKIDLTGLRGDKPEEAPMEQMFILPELRRQIKDSLVSVVKSDDDNRRVFLRKGGRNLVEAGGGAGKSTWAIWLQQQGLTCTEMLVVALRLRDWAERPLPSKEDLIREAAGQHLSEELDSTATRRWIESGALTFLVDGFDEVKPTVRDVVIRWVMELADVVGACPVLMTSRPLTTDHLDKLPQSWNRYFLQPFDTARIKDYVGRWYRYFPGLREEKRAVDVDKLTEEWQSDPALAHLVGTPLMLATVLMVHHLDGSLPKGRSALYRRYINGMLGLWDDRRHLKVSAVEIKQTEKRFLLTRVAVHLHFSGQEQIEEEELLRLLEEELKRQHLIHDPRHVLDALRERSGLLVGPGTYSFVHKSVGEYLLAEALDDGTLRDDDGQVIDRARLFLERENDRWNNIMFFWAGLARLADLEGFIDLVESETRRPDWDLVAGLLYDASNRLSLDSFRDRFRRLLRRPIEWREEEMHGWSMSSLPADRWEIMEFPDMGIRSTQPLDFWGAFDELVGEKKIDWSVCESPNPFIAPAVWIRFISSIVDHGQFSLAFQQRYLLDEDRFVPGYVFALGWLDDAWASVNYDQGWLRERIQIVYNFDPRATGYAPASLLSQAANTVTWWDRSDNAKRLRAIITALLDTEGINWSDEWLSATAEMEGGHFGSEQKDLLKVVAELFSLVNETSPLIEQKLLDEGIAYVNALMAKRDGKSLPSVER